MTTFLSVIVWSNSYGGWMSAWDVMKLKHFYGWNGQKCLVDFWGQNGYSFITLI